MRDSVRIHPSDNVYVALRALPKGAVVGTGQDAARLIEDIPMGHKVAARPIPAGEEVVKYGAPIGRASADIPAGAWVHAHNLQTGLTGEINYTYRRATAAADDALARAARGKTFQGFLRDGGAVGIRNAIFVIPTVGCVNKVAQRIAQRATRALRGSVDDVIAFSHDTGCAQMGDEEDAMRILAGLAKHPNAGGALIVGLGCETNRIEVFERYLGAYNKERVLLMNCQSVEDEIAHGARLVDTLIDRTAGDARAPFGVDRLIVGVKCGGSDGLSGITANPVIGRFSDVCVAGGGTVIMTEVPEMFGAEHLLLRRCKDEAAFDEVACMLNGFKRYLQKHGRPVHENPTPGNRDGGITTLEDKSLGCTQKAGASPVQGVIPYGGHARGKGLYLLDSPAFDLVSTTALAASGAQLILFSTGRGTPFSSPVPTIKLSTNSRLTEAKKQWIDFDASQVLTGVSYESAGDRLLDKALAVASGEKLHSETMGYYDMAIFRHGVTV